MSARLRVIPRVNDQTRVRHVADDFQQEVLYTGASRWEHAISLSVQFALDYLIKRSPVGEQKEGAKEKKKH